MRDMVLTRARTIRVLREAEGPEYVS